jgi:hypothetical protein
MTLNEWVLLMKPKYLRTVCGWRINDCSFSLVASLRGEIERGKFGHVPQWVCDDCGPVDEPETVCTYRGCGFESFTGPEPAEYEYRCPSCDRLETVYKYEGKGGPFRVIRCFTIHSPGTYPKDLNHET